MGPFRGREPDRGQSRDGGMSVICRGAPLHYLTDRSHGGRPVGMTSLLAVVGARALQVAAALEHGWRASGALGAGDLRHRAIIAAITDDGRSVVLIAQPCGQPRFGVERSGPSDEVAGVPLAQAADRYGVGQRRHGRRLGG